jgi:hypothetical protein
VERGIEVVGRAWQPGFQHHGVATDVASLDAIASRAGFPEHGPVVRPDHEDDPRVRKGLTSTEALHGAFQAALRESATGRVFVESDLRAHLNPSRMTVIASATRDLVERLARRCAASAAPGFGKVGIVEGLPCGLCGTPTREAVADAYGCVHCDHREHRPREGATRADPARCDVCNP